MFSYPNFLPRGASTNPIASKSQMTSELLALALLGSPKVIEEKKRMEEQWRTAVKKVHPSSQADFADALNQLVFFAMVWVTGEDPLVPWIFRTEVPPHRWGHVELPGTIGLINNPDTTYRMAILEGTSSYILQGRLHSCPAIDYSISILSPNLVTLCNPLGENLIREEDGSFTVTIDNKPGEPGRNHLELGTGRNQLLIRDTVLNGMSEKPMFLHISRTAGPPESSAPTFENLEDAAVASMRQALHIALSVEKLIDAEETNLLAQPVIRSTGGFLATQANNIGHLIVKDDEAFVLTLRLGGAKYMTFPVNNRWQVQADFIKSQTSLNNWQALPNADGTYTFVVSKTDPGVHNWIDTVGRQELVLQLRWQGLPSVLPASGGPGIVSQRLVKLSQLRDALPNETVFVDYAQRASQLENRAHAFAWLS